MTNRHLPPPPYFLVSKPQIRLGISEGASWHAKFKHSAYVFAGGLPFDLTEGDILAVFSQYGEIVDVNLVRAEDTGKSRGFAFICYEDQRSTVLAVDNLNGAKVVGRIIKVEHVEDYRLKDKEAAKRKDWKCGCGVENFKFRDNCYKCGGSRPTPPKQEGKADEQDANHRRGGGVQADDRVRHHDERVPEDERAAVEVSDVAARRAEAWEGAAFSAITQTSEEDEMIKALKARKEAAMARAKAAAEGLPLPGGDKALEDARKEAKRARKEAKKAKKEGKRQKKEKKKKGEGSRDADGDGLGSSSEEEGALQARSNKRYEGRNERDDAYGRDGRRRSRSRSRDVGRRRSRSRSRSRDRRPRDYTNKYGGRDERRGGLADRDERRLEYNRDHYHRDRR